MGLKTPLYAEHQALGARMVSFGGWEMPLHYGSQIEEHHRVRQDAGMFDVSHMQILDLDGEQALPFLRYVIANDAARLATEGRALYGCMLNDAGGVVDDLILYFRGSGRYRMVVNAATAEKDLAWIRDRAAGFDVDFRARRDLAMIAVQGPGARRRAVDLFPGELREPAMSLRAFAAAERGDWFVARTGYTGEDGFEILCPAGEAPALWRGLANAGIAPCGLGARDTLRLEAGLNLYGQDMDEDTSPLESGLAWTIAWEPAERDFVGRRALEAQRDRGGLLRFVGLLLTGRGVLRPHQEVRSGGEPAGEITSGGFSPTLQKSIGFARVKPDTASECEVWIRGKAVAARVVARAFVRNGKPGVDP